MNPSTKSSWWHNATTEQRLAQIDGGIECGMTSTQIAMASRTSRNVIGAYASAHGRVFPHKARPATVRHHSVLRNRKAYLRGDPIDLWGNTEAQEEFLDEREGA